MCRVIFVGVHNKPGMRPLDSRTRTGKVIDRIVKELPNEFECLRTNLFDQDHWPLDPDQWQAIAHWKERVDPRPSDIIVTLGEFVNEIFRKTRTPSIRVGHPASLWSKEKKEDYITKLYVMICTTHNGQEVKHG